MLIASHITIGPLVAEDFGAHARYSYAEVLQGDDAIAVGAGRQVCRKQVGRRWRRPPLASGAPQKAVSLHRSKIAKPPEISQLQTLKKVAGSYSMDMKSVGVKVLKDSQQMPEGSMRQETMFSSQIETK